MGERAGAASVYGAVPGAILPTILGFLGGEAGRASAHMGGGNGDQADAAGFGGNLLGAALAAPVTGARPAERLIRDRSSQLTLNDAPDSHLALAQALMENAQNLPNGGIQLHGDEGLAQVGGPRAAPLQALVRQASRAPGGQSGAAAQMTPRPGEVQAATLGTADMIAPPIEDPAALGVRAQNAASGSLRGTRSEINEIANPDYRALETQLMPGDQYAQLLQNPSYQAALEAVRNSPEIAATLQGVPQNSLSFINAVKHQLGSMEGAAQVSPLNPGGNNFLAALRGSAGTNVDAAASAISPQWENANSIVSQGRAGVLEPMQAGPLGDIGGRPGVPSQADAGAAARSLYPSNPLEGQPNVTMQALHSLDSVDPGVAADLTRLRLVDALDRGTRRNQGGVSLRGGANVANDIAGNRTGGETFRAGVGEVAPGASSTVDTLIQALQATGTRAAEGSATATDTAALESLGAGELPVEGAKAIFTPHQIPNRIGRWLDARQTNSNAGEIMRVMGLPPEEFSAYMRQLPHAEARNRITGLIKALGAANAEQQQGAF